MSGHEGSKVPGMGRFGYSDSSDDSDFRMVRMFRWFGLSDDSDFRMVRMVQPTLKLRLTSRMAGGFGGVEVRKAVR